MKCNQCGNDGFSRIGQHFSLSSCEYPDIPRNSMNIIIGCLLGDGHINMSSKNGQFHLRLTNKKALNYIKKMLPEWMITEAGIYLDRTKEESLKQVKNINNNAKSCKDYYGIRTIRHPKFTEIRKNWYDGSRKIAPNRKFNKTELKYWYVTDGSISTHPDKKFKHKSMICAKNHIENGMGVDVFSKCPVTPKIYDNVFQFSVQDTEDFLNFIGSPVPGFEYKWNLSNRKV